MAEEGLLFDAEYQTFQRPDRDSEVTPCGYIFQGLECHTIVDVPLPGIHFGSWSKWAEVVATDNPYIKTGWWCRSRIQSRVISRRQHCREVWKKNCPPYDTRYGRWRNRSCDVQQIRTETVCCPQKQDPNLTKGCGVPTVGPFYTSWSDSATLGCRRE